VLRVSNSPRHSRKTNEISIRAFPEAPNPRVAITKSQKIIKEFERNAMIVNMTKDNIVKKPKQDNENYATKPSIYAQEMAAMDHKIMRLEKYIQVLADHAGIDLEKIHI
jgi:hypothetical protein